MAGKRLGSRARRIAKDDIYAPRVRGLSHGAFRLFWTLQCEADDRGRFEADPRLLAARIFQLGEAPLAEAYDTLDELRAAKLVRLYEAEGEAYGEVLDWSQFQPLRRPAKAGFPAPPEDANADSGAFIPPASSQHLAGMKPAFSRLDAGQMPKAPPVDSDTSDLAGMKPAFSRLDAGMKPAKSKESESLAFDARVSEEPAPNARLGVRARARLYSPVREKLNRGGAGGVAPASGAAGVEAEAAGEGNGIQPPDDDIEGVAKLSKGKRQLYQRHEAACKRLWQAQNEIRKELGLRRLKATGARLVPIARRLEDGASEEDALAVLAEYGRQHRENPTGRCWLNGVTNWRQGNFDRTLGMLPADKPRQALVGAAQPMAFDEYPEGSAESADLEELFGDFVDS